MTCELNTYTLTLPFAFLFVKQNQSIIDNTPVAKEHVVLKFTSFTDIKTSEIFASTNVEKCSAPVVHQMTMHVINQVPSYGLTAAGASVDAASPNWRAYLSASTHSASDFLPIMLMKAYPAINFTIQHMFVTATGKPFIFCSDSMHLLKNIVTAMDLSSTKNSLRNIKYGNCPVNLGMIEIAFRATGGGTNQMQPTKLCDSCFFRNARSKMDCTLSLIILSGSVARMLRAAVEDDTVELGFKNKYVYMPLIHFCEMCNLLVDITNGRNRDFYTPQNGHQKQIQLLNILDWFSKWKMEHDAAVEAETKNQYNFFAPETWQCIQILILSHVTLIQLYSIEKGMTVNPLVLCTDSVEHHFGNSRQHQGGSTAGLTVQQADTADTLAGVTNAFHWDTVGNNRHSKTVNNKDNLRKRKKEKF